MKVYLNALGVINPLGKSRREVATSLFEGSRAGLVLRHDLLSERAVRVGEVPWQLAEVPSRLAHLDCRNNRLALTALREIEDDIKRAAGRVGPHRVAVLMGTSTSGIADRMIPNTLAISVVQNRPNFSNMFDIERPPV